MMTRRVSRLEKWNPRHRSPGTLLHTINVPVEGASREEQIEVVAVAPHFTFVRVVGRRSPMGTGIAFAVGERRRPGSGAADAFVLCWTGGSTARHVVHRVNRHEEKGVRQTQPSQAIRLE